MMHKRICGIPFGTILIGLAVLVGSFSGTLWALNTFFDHPAGRGPALAALPPLHPVTRTSVVIAPVAISARAIRDVMEAQAPRNLAGTRDNPLGDLLGKADIGWNITRGALAVAGGGSGLTISAPLNGTLRVTGQLSNKAGDITGSITKLLNDRLGSAAQELTTRALDQRADIRGTASIISRPSLQPSWRIEPNLSANVALSENTMMIAGIKLNLASEVKPLLDRTVNDQMVALQERLRNDPTLEQTARREWMKLCRAIPLGAASAGAPKLWLELRPTKAFAADPRMTPDWLIITMGVQAETRIVPSETKPNCPFPQRLEIVRQLDQGKVNIAVPIDVPFTELNRVLETQLKGKTFPEDASAAAAVTIRSASVAASGDRLLISLRVAAREKASWFGFGTEAWVHIWGKPALDRDKQVLRLTEVALDVDSDSALLDVAVQTAMPYLQSALADNAVVELTPFAASARASIEAAIGDFQKQADGVKVEAAVNELRLVGIEFDSRTLRVTAEADATARAQVTKLAAQ